MAEGILKDSETGALGRMLERKENPISSVPSMLTVRRVFICVHLRHLRTGDVFDPSA